MPSTSITITKHADHLRRRYQSTVRQAERARESIKTLAAEEAVAKQRADEADDALKTACKEAGISRYWSATDSGDPDYIEDLLDLAPRKPARPIGKHFRRPAA